MHVDNGKQVDRSLAFVQGEQSSSVWVTEYSQWVAHPGSETLSNSPLPPPPPSRHHTHHDPSSSKSVSQSQLSPASTSEETSTSTHSPTSSILTGTPCHIHEHCHNTPCYAWTRSSRALNLNHTIHSQKWVTTLIHHRPNLLLCRRESHHLRL